MARSRSGTSPTGAGRTSCKAAHLARSYASALCGPRARADRASSPQPPSSAHYVGYVEDNESIEAIMKKFETVEALKQEAREAAGSRQGRDEPHE